MADVKNLTHAEFMDAFYKGKGRALLHVQRFGDEGLKDVLLEACLHEVGYDKQMEDRGWWMIQIIKATSEPDNYFNPVMAVYLENNRWQDLPQQSDIIEWLAANGNASAKALLYKKYELQQFDGWEMQSIGRRLVRLDGIDGLLYAADISGKRLLADSTHGERNWLTDYACEVCGEAEVKTALEKAAETNPAIKTYVDKVLEACGGLRSKQEEEPVDKPSAAISLQEFLEQIEALTLESKTSAMRSVSRQLARQASDADILTLFGHMLSEKRKPQILRYLWCFSHRDMPRLEPEILELMQSSDELIRFNAINAFSRIRSEKLRELAITMLNAGNMEAIALFENNFREGDFAYIASRLTVTQDREDMHSACSDLLDVCEKNKAPDALGCLVWIYENTPCSACRSYAVNGLIALNILPDFIKEECRYDCNDETRDAVA